MPADTIQIDNLCDYQCVCGENPLWHPDQNKLYWTDIETGRLFRYDPAADAHEQIYEGRKVGGFTIQADGRLLLFMDRGTVALWDEGVLEPIIDEIPDEVETRFNDVMADPEGRVFAGTMPAPDRKGRLYRIERDGSYRIILEDIGCSNGMGFTPDLKQMYYTDSGARTIYLFDCDRATGELTNRRDVVTVPEGQGVPDGMTVDNHGEIWSARWDGYGVFHYTADGVERDKVKLPAKKISSAIFGGPDLTDLYLTSAGGNDKNENGAEAGALFRVRGLGVHGAAEWRSRIGG